MNWIQPISTYWINSLIEFYQKKFYNWIIYWIELNNLLNWIFMKQFLNWTLNSINFGQNSNIELNQFGYPDSCPTPRKKSCFWGSFLQKTASHGQTVHFWLDSVIHRWKALDLSFLMVFLKKYFVNPAKCQNFVDASGQIFSLILRPCHMYSTIYKYVCMYVMLCNILKYVIQL